MSLAIVDNPVPSGTLRCYSGDYSEAMVVPVVRSAHNAGMSLDALQILGYCPPSVVY